MTIERRIWRLANLVTVLLILVSARLVYWQLIRGDELQPVALNPVAAAQAYDDLRGDDTTQDAIDELKRSGGQMAGLPQPVVQRTIDLLNNITRGPVYDRSGRILASDQAAEDGSRVRVYNEPSLAHALGYVSGIRTGISGLEHTYNSTLLGLDRPDVQVDQLIHQPITGSSLVLTIDTQIQRAAERALGERTGAIVALDGHSGAVLAMVSGPRFDPNRILDPEYASSLLAGCEDTQNCPSPLLNRATQGLYTPGSTWKTVTLIAGLDTGQVTPKTVFDFGRPRTDSSGRTYYVYEVDGGQIPDPNHRESKLDLPASYAKSANAAFARIGAEMPPEVFIDYAQRLGFSRPEPFPLEIESSPSQLAQDVNSIRTNNLLRAATAIGQGELLATPMNMAMVVLSVINDGDLPVPYLVESVRSPTGRVLDTAPNRQVLRDLMSPETAEEAADIMITAVKTGSGKLANFPNAQIGGKTGTAQVGGDLQPHAWFVGFAKDEGRAVVIAVLLENAGSGSEVAAPVFSEVASVAMERLGTPVEMELPTPVPPTPLPTLQEPPTPTPAPQAQPTPAATQGGAPADEPTPSPDYADLPAPDIPRDPNKVDLTAGSASCQLDEDGPVGSGQFIWPSQYQALSGGDFREGHPGIDLSTPAGTPVYAADAGLVIFAGWTGSVGYGNAVLIDHGNGYRTLYAHLSQVSTYCGAAVQQKKLIGLAGETGNASGPHLHFEVRVPGGYINPLRVLPTP